MGGRGAPSGISLSANQQNHRLSGLCLAQPGEKPPPVTDILDVHADHLGFGVAKVVFKKIHRTKIGAVT